MTDQAGHALDPLLRPRSIAVVGASARENTVGFEALNNLTRGKFQGDLYPVNPGYSELAGFRCYGSLSTLPQVPEMVMFAVSDERIETLLDEAISLGVRAVTLLSTLVVNDDLRPRQGPNHRPQQTLRERIASKLSDASVLCCGGNGMGYFNYRDNIWAGGFDSRDHPEAGHVVLLSQSGSGMCGIVDCETRIDFNFVASTGQELTVTLGDYLDFVLDLPETRVVGLFVERLRDARVFRRALKKAQALQIPVVALKTGRTAFAAELAVSHSGALAGNDGAYQALFDRFGVQRVRDMDELATALILFSQSGPLGPGGLVTLHDSGGEQQLMADLAAEKNVPLTRLSDETVNALEQVLDPELPAVNPLDGWSRGGPEAGNQMKRALALMLADSGAACGALVHDRAPGGTIYSSYVDYLEYARARSDKPLALVASHQGTGTDPKVDRVTRELGTPVLDGVSSYLAGVRCLFGYRDFVQRSQADNLAVPKLDDDLWDRVGCLEPDEMTAFRLLESCGIIVPKMKITSDADTAAALWRDWKAPLVLKTTRADIPHKSDVGGVVAGLNDEPTIRSVHARLAEKFDAPVMAAALAPPGVEMFLGMTRDRDLGAVVLIGFGGVHAEILHDVITVLPPFGPAEALGLMDRLRLRPLLDGAGGAAASDVQSFAEAAARFSVLAAQFDHSVTAFDVNPVIVHPSGCVAVDALMIRGEIPVESQRKSA